MGGLEVEAEVLGEERGPEVDAARTRLKVVEVDVDGDGVQSDHDELVERETLKTGEVGECEARLTQGWAAAVRIAMGAEVRLSVSYAGGGSLVSKDCSTAGAELAGE